MQNTQTLTRWIIDPVHTRVRFEARYLMISTVSGWFRELEGSVLSGDEQFNDSAIQFTIYTNSLFTGVEERDNHLRSCDFFDVARYPTIKFRSEKISVDGDKFRISGILTIKDIHQPLDFVATYLGTILDLNGNTKAGFEMDASFDRKDFNITWNQFLDQKGVLISDQVKIHADIQLLRLG